MRREERVLFVAVLTGPREVPMRAAYQSPESNNTQKKSLSYKEWVL